MRTTAGLRSDPSPLLVVVALATLLFATAGSARAQLLERLGDAAKREAEAETERQVRQAVRTAIRCVAGDRVCEERARREGREVVLVDEHGDPVNEASPADRRAIREISEGWLRNARSRNAAAITTHFAPHAVVLQSGRAPIVGPDAIRADIEADWGRNPDFTIDWESTSLTVATSGDLAWERGTWTFDPDGPGPREQTAGAFVTIYEKIDGDWKIAADVGVSTGYGDSGEETR